MGSKHQKIIRVDGSSPWAIIRLPRALPRLQAADFAWAYIWALIYDRKMWVEVPTLSGTELVCDCTIGRYCHRHVLHVLANNPKLCFDLQTKVVLANVKQADYDKSPDRYPLIRKVFEQVWTAAGFNNASPDKKIEEPAKEKSIGQEIIETMKETGDFGTQDPETDPTPIPLG